MNTHIHLNIFSANNIEQSNNMVGFLSLNLSRSLVIDIEFTWWCLDVYPCFKYSSSALRFFEAKKHTLTS